MKPREALAEAVASVESDSTASLGRRGLVEYDAMLAVLRAYVTCDDAAVRAFVTSRGWTIQTTVALKGKQLVHLSQAFQREAKALLEEIS